MRQPSRASVAAAVVLAAALAVFFHKVVFLGEVFSPADLLFSFPPWHTAGAPQQPSNHLRSDEVFLHHPVMHSHWDRLKRGELPQLDPWQLAGEPAFLQGLFAGLVVNPLAAVYYLAPAARADGLFALLRLWAAGTFMWMFCRTLGLRAIASLFGAVAFMLNGHFVVWLSSPIPTVALWLPLALVAAERLLLVPRPRSACLLALAVAPMYLGGYLPTAIVAVTLVAGYLLVGALKGLRPLAAIGWAAAGGVLSLVLGAVGMIPGMWNLQASDLVGRTAASTYPAWNLATFVYPDFWGTPMDFTWWNQATNYCEAVTYVGLVPLVLAPVGLLTARDWRASYFAAVAVVVLGAVYGAPGLGFLANVPVLRSINTFRWIVAVPMAASVLGAFAIDRLVSGDARRRPAAGLLALAFGVGLVVAYAYAVYDGIEGIPDFHRGNVAAGGVRAAAVVALALFLIAALGRRRWRPAAPAAALVALVAADLVDAGVRFNPTVPADRMYPATGGLAWLQRRASGWRVAFTGDPPVGMMPGTTPAEFGLRAVGGYDFVRDALYQELLAAGLAEERIVSPHSGYVYVDRRINPFSPVWDLLNVKYFVTPPASDLARLTPFASVGVSDTTPGEIVDGRAIGQTLFCPAPGLAGIDVLPGTYGRGKDVLQGDLVFRLREEGAAVDRVARRIPLAALADNRPLAIRFPPLADSANRRYRFWFESPGATRGRAVTLWALGADGYRAGSRLENGEPQPGDLRFQAYVAAATHGALRDVYRGEMNIVENVDVLPAAWIVHAIDVERAAAMPARLRDAYPARDRALVERDPGLDAGRAGLTSGRGGADTVKVGRPRPERIVAEVNLAARGLLVFSEKLNRRWRVTIDGARAEPVRANAVLFGVVVPEGRHRVVAVYRDDVLLASAAASGAALVLVLGALLWPLRRTERRPRRADS